MAVGGPINNSLVYFTQGSRPSSLLLDDHLLGPKLPLLGNSERRPSSHEDRKPKRLGQMLSGKTLMQEKRSSLTEQVKSTSYSRRGMEARASPHNNSTLQEAQGRKMLRQHRPSRKQGFAAELDEAHRAWVPWNTGAKAHTKNREGEVGEDFRAHRELEPRERSPSLHHSRASGMLQKNKHQRWYRKGQN